MLYAHRVFFRHLQLHDLLKGPHRFQVFAVFVPLHPITAAAALPARLAKVCVCVCIIGGHGVMCSVLTLTVGNSQGMGGVEFDKVYGIYFSPGFLHLSVARYAASWT